MSKNTLRDLLYFLPFLILILGCEPPKTASGFSKISPAFYHWKTNFSPTDFELNKLDSLNVRKFYIKFFDVDWDFDKKNAFPTADVNFKIIPNDSVEIVPTVFITNRTLANISMSDIPNLARQINDKIFRLMPSGLKTGLSDTLLMSDNPVREIQIDCDWTLSTKDRFFELIHVLDNLFIEKGILISATIRLHQIKFFEKTGVPPVDRGILMFYNMGDLENWATENSILDLEIGQQYFQNFDKYPLDLDVALPIFHWGILFRDSEMIKIINNLSEADLSDESRFKKLTENRFRVIKSTYLNGQYLYRGDGIRLEGIDFEELKKSAEKLGQLIENEKITVSFYHLDSLNFEKFSAEKLNVVLNAF